MKATLKNTFAALTFGLLAMGSNVAGAHTLTLNLGADAGATDYFGLICSTEGGTDTDHLLVQVQSNTPNGPLLSAQVHKGSVATNTTDLVSGDAEASPPSRTKGGNGLYHLLINKAGPGAVAYTLTIHCLDVTGTLHTGTDGVVYQY